MMIGSIKEYCFCEVNTVRCSSMESYSEKILGVPFFRGSLFGCLIVIR